MSQITTDDIKLFIDKIKEIYGKDFPTGVHLYETIYDAAYLCAITATDKTKGAMGIGLISNMNPEYKHPQETYLITLGGTELMNAEESLGIEEDILSAFGRPNIYSKSAINLIKRHIPKNSYIIMYGYSLGSMVMQQILADSYIKKNYHFICCIGIGCPTINPYKRQSIIRINDENDYVRHLSMWEILFPWMCHRDEEICRDGNYKTTIGGHALSYVDKDNKIWSDVDILGKVKGYGSILVNFTAMTYYFIE
jgi:hypothetical protein